MGIWDVVKGLGTAAVSIVCPAAIPVIAAVNQFLPDDKKLDVNTATGEQLMSARESLPPDARVEVDRISAKVEVSRLENQAETYQVLSAADGQSTRPTIALIMTWCFAIQFNAVGGALAYAIYSEKTDGIAELWPFIVAFFGMTLGVIRAYFGILAKEQGQRLGVESKGLLGAAAGLLGKWKG